MPRVINHSTIVVEESLVIKPSAASVVVVNEFVPDPKKPAISMLSFELSRYIV